ncbi:MAG: CCA tRNA nucleotidyltransferase [Gemmatimonadota bacterium]|nr:CCA tRNA nucleotidyltransferase [Gemmatimonadota bacterium]
MSVRIEVPGPVRELVEQLEDAEFETWTVGGAVRDALRGKPAEREDWDLATRATPQQMRRVFRRTIPLGPEYGTLGVFGSDGVLYEVTTFRHDVVTYGRKAVVAFAESLDEDLSRRDFTVNAMAWHPRREVLRDPHGGERDLQAGILRAVGDPAERFREDYLRVLRGLRFAGSLGLEIEPGTWSGMTAAVPGLDRLSRERIREELMKVLAGREPSRTLRLYRRCGALDRVFGEMAPVAGRGALATVDAVAEGGVAGAAEDTPVGVVRLAALLLFGAGDGNGNGSAAVAELLVGLRFSRDEVERVTEAMSGGLGPTAEQMADPVARRRWVAGTGWGGVGDVFRVWIAALRAGTATRAEDEVRRMIAAATRDRDTGVPLSVADLAIAGRDLVARGWKPGPGIGRALHRLLDAVWANPALNTRTALMEMVAGMEEGE